MLIRDHVIETYKEFDLGIKKLLGEQIKLIVVSKIAFTCRTTSVSILNF